MDRGEYRRIIEALLLVSEKPLLINHIRDVLGEEDTTLIRTLLIELKEEYHTQNRGFGLVEVAGGFQMITDPALGRWLKKLYSSRQDQLLSGPALETLAVVAYRQPATRSDVEAIRGVNVEGVLKTLLERGLIKISGRKEVVGRPIIYSTTNEFLQYFGLNGLGELPRLEEFIKEPVRKEG